MIVSNTCQHNKSTAVPFTCRILSAKPADITQVKIWTDGPVSQFKNQYVMASMNMLSKKHKISLTLNFSATSHGKGPVDSVGTTLKKQATEKVQICKVVVNNVGEFYQAVQDSSMITLMNTTELQKYSNEQLETLFSNSTVIHWIAGFHNIEQS